MDLHQEKYIVLVLNDRLWDSYDSLDGHQKYIKNSF